MNGQMMPKTEEDYQAEGDAHTLIQAEMIMGDEKRMEKAKQACQWMIEEEDKKQEAMKRIAGAKLEYLKSPKG